MADELETVWSGSTGWVNGAGRYFAVEPIQPRKSDEQIRAECRMTNPVPLGRPKKDIVGTVRERILHQLDGGQWMSASKLAERLGIQSSDRASFQNLSHCLRAMWMEGQLTRQEFQGSGYHKFGTLMYRRKEAR